jgi:hypothetical protein
MKYIKGKLTQNMIEVTQKINNILQNDKNNINIGFGF